MVEFEKERKIEKEAYAIINFFQLLSQANLAEQSQLPEANFVAIGGMATIERLIINCKNKNIDIFTNSTGDLFQQLEERIGYMNKLTVSKSNLTEEATAVFERLTELYSASSGIQEQAYLDLAATRIIPAEKMLEILSFRPKTKKIGER